VVSVQQWAEVRRMGFVEGLAIREIRRRTGLHRETIRRALRCSTPPSYVRPVKGSKLDPFKDEIHRLLRADAEIESQRIREILIELGFEGGKTIVDDYVRGVRPFFADQRTFQRTVYRPGDVLQFDLWQPKREIPVGYGQTRKGYVVVGALGYSRFGAGALVFSKEAPDVLWGMWRCVGRIGVLPERLVVDREGCLHAGGGRPTEEFASFCGQLSVGWRILDPGDCQAKGVSERLQGFMETSFEPGRSFANELDFQDQLDRWFSERANVRCIARSASVRSTGWSANGRACGRCRSPGRISTAGSCCECRHSRTCTSIATTTRWIRGLSAGGSRCVSRSARSLWSRWTPACWPASTGACSLLGRSSPTPPTLRRSSGCGLSVIAASRSPARTCRFATCRSMTGWRHRWDRRPSSRICSGR
jgi:transposase